MKRWIAVLGACTVLSTLPMGAFAHGGYDAGDAALGGLIGGVVGGLIGTTIGPAPVVVERYEPARPVVVERYAPPPVVVERSAPVVVERYGPSVAYFRDGHRGWRDHEWREHEWRKHERREHDWHRRHRDDDDD
ncbi:MAG: hypothetical protein WCA32_12330 [Chromatiaceae bacterium]